MNSILTMPKISSFSVDINRLKIGKNSPLRQSEPHIHDVCEIYVNLSGDVSFMVENRIYPIQYGDIIITAPYEYHHCIYHSEKEHDHYWIMFSPHENESLFSFFYNKKNNLIRLPKEKLNYFLKSCEQLINTSNNESLGFTANFFKIINYISQELIENNDEITLKKLPEELKKILNYISINFATLNSIKSLENQFYMSITTIERSFRKYLSITPKRYLEDTKLAHSCKLLRNNSTVTEASIECGFSDYSHFIYVFKKKFGITPLKYKKLIET